MHAVLLILTDFQMKKLRTVKSDEHGGQRCGPLLAIFINHVAFYWPNKHYEEENYRICKTDLYDEPAANFKLQGS